MDWTIQEEPKPARGKGQGAKLCTGVPVGGRGPSSVGDCGMSSLHGIYLTSHTFILT